MAKQEEQLQIQKDEAKEEVIDEPAQLMPDSQPQSKNKIAENI